MLFLFYAKKLPTPSCITIHITIPVCFIFSAIPFIEFFPIVNCTIDIHVSIFIGMFTNIFTVPNKKTKWHRQQYKTICTSQNECNGGKNRLTFSPRLKQGDSCINHHCTATEVVASYTMSDRRYFPCVPRYGMYFSSGLLLKSFTQNVNGSVFVAVMNRVTRRAFPFPDA